MQKLLISRRQKEEVHEVLDKLEPEKFGKGAYCELSYTPSKLADHILFKEANFLKKFEEEASRSRELESRNKTLGDQVEYLKREKNGIEVSLTKMITMYKGIITDMENKNEERADDSQKKLKTELQRIVGEKEEEAKYIQSQKEILEGRIQELESLSETQKEELKRLNRNKNDVQKDLDELIVDHRRLNEKYQQLEKESEEKLDKAKQDYDQLKKDFGDAEIQWKNHLHEAVHNKDLEIEQIERTHRAEQEKAESERKSELMMKDQEINELSRTLDAETSRMKEIIGVKDKMIDALTIDNHKERSRVLALTREYETEINHLNHEKNRLLDEVELFARDNQALGKEKALLTDELEKENLNLRDLLYESSVQLQKCKGELVNLARDNTRLLTRVKSGEEEAKTWRDSYYISKNRPS